MFKQYKQVSEEYEKGELFKAKLLARAQRLLVYTSAILMSLAFVQYRVTHWTLSWTLLGQLMISILPTAAIAAGIEIGLIMGAASVRRNKRNWLSWATLILATIFSTTGGELFFNKLAENQPLEIHFAFALIGLFVPILQITFELNKQSIKDFIKEAADISDVRNHILQKQTESMIVETRFNTRSASIQKQEVKDKIEANSDRMVVDMVSEQERQTVVTEVQEQDTQHVIEIVLETLRHELRTLVQDMSGQQQLPQTTSQTQNSEDSPKQLDVQEQQDTRPVPVTRALTIVPNTAGQDSSHKVPKQKQIATYLGTLSQDEQIYYWNNLAVLANKFETGTKTAQRAFEAYPTAKQRRAQ